MLDHIDALRGLVFQDFCAVLLSADSQEFQAVNGAGGDMGIDGFLTVGDAVFQAYGPDRYLLHKLRAKIDDTIMKTVRPRASGSPTARRLVFLTPFDLTLEAHTHLQQAAEAHQISAVSWGAAKLTELLLKHPHVRKGFPQFLLPDILEELKLVRDAATQQRPSGSSLEQVFGPDYHPQLHVLQQKPEGSVAELQADEWFRVRLYADVIRRRAFEPEDEDAFLDLVREIFWEDTQAVLEKPSHDRVLVEHRDAEWGFHRRWGWWTSGVLGMAATLRDLHRPGVYSIAHIALDLAKTLRMLAQIAGRGDVRVVFEIDPLRLAPAWDLSDLRAAGQAKGLLGGVQSPGTASTAHRTRVRREWCGAIGGLITSADAVTGAIIIDATREMHGARVRSSPLIESLPRLRDFHAEIQAR